jgi:hypothetical protein
MGRVEACIGHDVKAPVVAGDRIVAEAIRYDEPAELEDR